MGHPFPLLPSLWRKLWLKVACLPLDLRLELVQLVHIALHPHIHYTHTTVTCKTFSHNPRRCFHHLPSPKCFWLRASAPLVPQVTSCLAEALVIGCSHGAQACPMLGCAHCRFCLAKRSSPQRSCLFLVVGPIHWLAAYVRSCVDAISYWELMRIDYTAAYAARLACAKCFCESLSPLFRGEWWRGSWPWRRPLLGVSSSFGQKHGCGKLRPMHDSNMLQQSLPLLCSFSTLL